MTDEEHEERHYTLVCTARLHGFPKNWLLDMYRCQLKGLHAHNEALIAERDALRLALLGLGGVEELKAIYKDGVAT